MLRQKKEQAEADHKREFEEKRAAAAAKKKAKEEREAALAGEAAAAALTTDATGKFKAPKILPVSCPAVPVQKNQVCGFVLYVLLAYCSTAAHAPCCLLQLLSTMWPCSSTCYSMLVFVSFNSRVRACRSTVF